MEAQEHMNTLDSIKISCLVSFFFLLLEYGNPYQELKYQSAFSSQMYEFQTEFQAVMVRFYTSQSNPWSGQPAILLNERVCFS